MNVSRPYQAVVPTIDGDVLAVLSATTRPLTGRQVSELVRHGSQKAVSLVLDRLVTQGLVLREEAGRAYLHTLNRRHVAAPAVEILSDLRGELRRRLSAQIGDWVVSPHHASLFGSVARGDGGLDSDVDLLIVRLRAVDIEDQLWRAQIDELDQAVAAWTGNHASIIELSEAEFERLADANAAMARELVDDAVDLAGVPLRRALRTSA